MLFWLVIPDLRLISFTNPFLHIVFLFLPYCFHRFWTCTELSRHWHLFVLVSCARLSWTHSAFESTLKTLLSYRTVFLILRFVPPVNWTCVNYIAVSRVWWHLLSLLVCLWTWLGHFIGESLIITVPKHCCQKTTNTVGTHMTQHVTYVIVFFQKLHPKEVFRMWRTPFYFRKSTSQIRTGFVPKSFLSHMVSYDWPVRNMWHYWPQFHCAQQLKVWF